MIATNALFPTVLSIFLSIAVILSGAHIKDLASLTNALASTDIQRSDLDHHKIGADLHNHIDKVHLKSLLKSGPMQVDTRSLKLRHHQQKRPFEQRAFRDSWLHHLGFIDRA